ncbi:hypothetical protein [Candidatus Nitrospira bockiana]
MARLGKGVRAVGVTHFPLEQERKNQARVPDRQEEDDRAVRAPHAKKATKKSAVVRAERVKPSEERTISRRGAKGGKTGGSRAGLRSQSKKRGR